MLARLRTSAACAALIALACSARAQASASHPPAMRYYLSLGDSLAQGMQPDAAGITVNTAQGYADQLYAIEKARVPHLKLVKLGCGGETTASFDSGRGNPDAVLLGCNPAGGAQLLAAERFLRRHHARGEVSLVTLDIGANDVVGCASGASFDVGCVTRGVAAIEANLPKILRRLRRAAAPGTPMAAMTLYDPFLSLYLTPADRSEAVTIDGYAHNLNHSLERLYRASSFRIARVDAAFKTYDIAVPTGAPPAAVPLAVTEVCRLSWMCAPAPVGPNIHANAAGYALIARVFAEAFAH